METEAGQDFFFQACPIEDATINIYYRYYALLKIISLR